MKREAQAAVMLLLGVVILRITWTDLFLNYVKEPMRPLLLTSGVFLIILGVWSWIAATKKAAAIAGSDHGHDHAKAPIIAWLMMLPVAAIFLIAPPPLGADAAERDSGVQPLAEVPASSFPALPDPDPVPLDLADDSLRAIYDGGPTLQGRTIVLEGFVTPSDDGGWYLTRFVSSCCAADASAVKVQIQDAPAPPADQWVSVTGRHTPSEAAEAHTTAPAAFISESLTLIDPPKDTYL